MLGVLSCFWIVDYSFGVPNGRLKSDTGSTAPPWMGSGAFVRNKSSPLNAPSNDKLYYRRSLHLTFSTKRLLCDLCECKLTCETPGLPSKVFMGKEMACLSCNLGYSTEPDVLWKCAVDYNEWTWGSVMGLTWIRADIDLLTLCWEFMVAVSVVRSISAFIWNSKSRISSGHWRPMSTMLHMLKFVPL